MPPASVPPPHAESESHAGAFSTCAFCPRLCRHVCPVAVGSAWESATPTAIMTAVWWSEMGMAPVELAHQATSLCLGCGACEAHCKNHIPVPARIWDWQARHGGTVAPAALPRIVGHAVEVAVLGSEPDWLKPAAGEGGGPLAWCRSPDALGFAAWEAGDSEVLARVARHFSGRKAVTASLDIARVLGAAGVPVRVLGAPEAGTPELKGRFLTCFEGAQTTPSQLACCGRRAGFPEREPEAARRVAEENVRRIGQAPVACGDASCAAWLRAHGADVHGPVHGVRGPR